MAVKYLMKRRRSLLSTKDPDKVERLFTELPTPGQRYREAAHKDLQGDLGEDGHWGVRRSPLHVHHGRSLTADERRRLNGDATEDQFKAIVVATILDSNPERALDLLCEHYRVETTEARRGGGQGAVEGRPGGLLGEQEGDTGGEARVSIRPLHDTPRVLPPPAAVCRGTQRNREVRGQVRGRFHRVLPEGGRGTRGPNHPRETEADGASPGNRSASGHL